VKYFDVKYILVKDNERGVRPIILFATREGLKVASKSFLPYFYAEPFTIDGIDAEVLNGINVKDLKPTKKIPIEPNGKKKELVKVILTNPRHVPLLRKFLEETGKRTYESNIPFTSRFLVDSDKEIEREDNVYAFVDIEVKAKHLTDYENGEIITIAVVVNDKSYLITKNEKRKRSVETFEYENYKLDVQVIPVKNDIEMFLELAKIFHKENVTHFVAWNVLFDWEWITKKLEKVASEHKFLSPIILSPITLKSLFDSSLLPYFLDFSEIERDNINHYLPINYKKLYEKVKGKKLSIKDIPRILRQVVKSKGFFNSDLSEREIESIIEKHGKNLNLERIETFEEFVVALNLVYSNVMRKAEKYFVIERNDVPWKGQKTTNRKVEFKEIFGILIVDLLEAYKKVTNKEEESYRLDYIAKKVLGFGKSLEFDINIWKEKPEEIEKYNVNDAYLLKLINEKLGILELFEELKVITRVENINRVFSQTAMINNFFIHEMRKLGMIFPTKTKFEITLHLDGLEDSTIRRNGKLYKGKALIPNKDKIVEITNVEEEMIKESIIETYGKVEDFYKKSMPVEFDVLGKKIQAVLPFKPREIVKEFKDYYFELDGKVYSSKDFNSLKGEDEYFFGNLEKDNPVPGGYVRNVKKGLYETIAVFDFASLYPNLILTFNISPEALIDFDNVKIRRELEEVDKVGEVVNELLREQELSNDKMKWKIKTVKFEGNVTMSNKEGIIPHFIKKLIEKRYYYKHKEKEYEKLYNETGDEKYLRLSLQYHNKNWAFKILINAIYGWMGYVSSPVYHPILSSLVTTFGRMLDLWLIYKLKELGYQPLYADTDSIFIPLKTKFDGNNYDELKKEINFLNELFKKLLDGFVYSFVPRERYFLTENGYEKKEFKHTMEFEFEYLIYKIVFHQKKMYYYREIDLDGKKVPEKIKTKGLDVKRSDRMALQKLVQEKLMKHYMDVERININSFLRDVNAIIKSGYSSDVLYKYFNQEEDRLFDWLKAIAIPIKIGQESYKNDNSVQSKVLFFAREVLQDSFVIGSKYFVIPLKYDLNFNGRKVNIIAFKNKKDLDKVLKVMKGKFNNLLKFVNVKLLNVINLDNVRKYIEETYKRTIPQNS